MSKLTEQFLKQPLIAKYFSTEEQVLNAMLQPSRTGVRLIAFAGNYQSPYITTETRPESSRFGPELLLPQTTGDIIREQAIKLLEEQLKKLKEAR